MADEKEPAQKKGLHGWRAAVAVFGCGSLAAFAVFGLIVGVGGFFISAVSSGISPSGDDTPVGVVAPPSPRPTFNFDRFDLCNDTLTSVRALTFTLEEESEGPVDTSVDGGEWDDEDLVRSDACQGTVIPDAAYLEPWDIEFSYRAIIFSPEEDRDELAHSDLLDWWEDVGGEETEASASGEASFSDESYFVYTNSDSESTYSLVARKRSGVFRIDLSSNISTSQAAFENEVRKIVERLDFTLTNRIPE